MTDRLHGFVVTFKQDIREDDAESILGLLRQNSLVLDVSPIVRQPGDWAIEEKARADMRQRVLQALEHPIRNGA